MAEVGPSCAQAMSALEVGKLLERRREVLFYADVLSDVLLVQNRDIAAMLVESRLGALLRHPHLIETLRAYIGSGLSVSHTAKTLVVHPNAVTYRLGRVRELTRQGDDIFRETDLILALRAVDLLGDVAE